MPNPSRFKFSRNRTMSVELVENGDLRCTCRLVDAVSDMNVQIMVKMPDMEIASVSPVINRCYDRVEYEALKELPGLAGVRVGPGMIKIFKGLVSPAVADSQLLFMLEETCHGVILSSTKDMANMVPDDLMELESSIFRDMVKANIRLYNRCAAYGPGSSMVEGVEPPK